MSDEINIGDVSNSQAIAAGRNAKASVTNIYNLPDYRPDAVVNLPPPNPHFVGRVAQLELMAANFASAANPLVVTQAIAGLGGVGKTQLALAYAHTRRDLYDMLWLLRASDVPTLINELRLLGVTLELFKPEVQDADVIRTKVLSHLSSSKKRWLLLYDNVDELTPRELRPYLPGGGHLLITSRRAAAHWQPFGRTLALDTFTEAEATAFWQKRKLPDAPELTTLAKELGYLPLAMEQAAAFMQVQQLPAADYLAWFREARDSLWAEEEPPTDYPKTVATTWKINFEQASQRKGAADLLNLCCFLDPDGIPLDLIRQIAFVETLHATSLRATVADERQLRLALTALRDYSLLRQAEDGTITLHRLVQTVARDRLGAERARAWVELAVDLLHQVYHYDKHDMSTWEAAGALIPHMTSATDLAAQYDCNTKNVAFINNESGIYFNLRGHFISANLFFERALQIYEKVMGPEHSHTSASLHNLGVVLKNVGQFNAAKSILEQAVTIRKKTLGVEHSGTAESLSSLGSVLKEMGDFDTAQHYLEQALFIRKKLFGSSNLLTSISLDNLGALFQATGNLEAAEIYHEQALNILEEVLPPNHPDVAVSLNNLGSLFLATGDTDAAYPLLKRALSIREEIFEAEHPHIAQSANNFGALLYQANQKSEAIPFFQQAYSIRLRMLGNAHPETGNSIWWLGIIAEEAGNIEEAKSAYTQAYAIFERAHGSDHPRTQQVFGSLTRLTQ